MSPLYRLIYKSRATGQIKKDDLRDILSTSLEKNRPAGVHGALLATNTHYLQFLEGGFDEINQTFFRIVGDSRHLDHQLVSFGMVEKAIFSHWKMKAFGIFELSDAIKTKLMQQYGEEAGDVRLPVDETKALALLLDVELAS